MTVAVLSGSHMCTEMTLGLLPAHSSAHYMYSVASNSSIIGSSSTVLEPNK